MKLSHYFLGTALAMLLFAPVACMAGKCVTGAVCLLAALIAGRLASSVARSERFEGWIDRCEQFRDGEEIRPIRPMETTDSLTT